MSEGVATTPLEQLQRRLSAEALVPHVRQALGREQAEVVNWSCEAMRGGGGEFEGVLGVFRLYGEAQNGTQRLPWRLILKIVSGAQGGQSVTGSDYWKREALAYQSGLLRALPGDPRAPTCYGVSEIPGQVEATEEAWIWLAEIPQDRKLPWTPSRLRQAARALGHLNGAYLAQDLRSTYPWLSQGRVAERVAVSEPVLCNLGHYHQHPLVAACLPAEILHRLYALWQARETLLVPFQRLPRTLCHHDAFVRNLLLEPADAGERFVAIDWSDIGLGALGEEIAHLIGASYTFLDLDVRNIQEVEGQVWAGYLAGLHDAGWQGDVQVVRFGYSAASGFMRAIGWVGYLLPFVVEHLAAVEAVLGHSVEEMAAAWPLLLRHELALGEEALRLAGKM